MTARGRNEAPDSGIPWVPIVMTGLALVIIALDLWVLIPAWSGWRAGAPEAYPGQHRGLVRSWMLGIAVALSLLLPAWENRGFLRSRYWRRALYGLTWTLLAGAVLLMLAGR